MVGMVFDPNYKVLRAPEACFLNLPDFHFESQYCSVFRYRRVVNLVAAAGYRAIAPDHFSFGHSGKLPEH